MKILNVGCGPVEHGNYPGLEIICADRRDHDGADIENMEDLHYDNDEFDLVVCINALDHTVNAEAAIKELIRVGRSVYIDCALIQKTTSGKGHYWDILENGELTNGEQSLHLQDFGFTVEFIDNQMERRYNHIIARLNK